MSDLKHYDIAIIGLGAMGSAAAYQLTKAGARVIGFDRHLPPHGLGSSHGLTRVIREAYFEHPDYVPLLQRAYQLWQELEQASGEALLELTGGLMIGAPNSELVEGCLSSARQFGLPHELISSDTIMSRFPAFQLPSEFVAVAEPRTGFLRPEACIRVQLELALQAGLDLHAPAEVLGWDKQAGLFRIQTANQTFIAEKLVISAGAWLGRLVPDLNLPLQVTRQVLYWFEAKQAELFQLGHFPVFLLEAGPEAFLYGFPDSGEGFKVALHAKGTEINPDSLAHQQAPASELEHIRNLLTRYLPEAKGELLQTAVCMYTNTPDGHFLIDTHPLDPDILLVSPCSGHGFKFAAVIGEEVGRWARAQAFGHDLSLFGLDRLA